MEYCDHPIDQIDLVECDYERHVWICNACGAMWSSDCELDHDA